MSSMLNSKSPAYCTTLDSFIEQGKEMPLTYSKLCLTEVDDKGVIRIVYNLLDDYSEDLEEYLVEVNLTDEEVIKYKYKPKDERNISKEKLELFIKEALKGNVVKEDL